MNLTCTEEEEYIGDGVGTPRHNRGPRCRTSYYSHQLRVLFVSGNLRNFQDKDSKRCAPDGALPPCLCRASQGLR
jgi:hypothetical protein